MSFADGDLMDTASLSILRFIAAIIVILYHRHEQSELLQNAPAFLTAGPQMVTFFFVLSGFVLFLAYNEQKFISFKRYFIKRLIRIMPLTSMALFLSLMIAFRNENFDPVATILHILFLQSWFPPYPLSINGPAWFISDLMTFYLLFPLLLLILREFKPNPKSVLISALLLWFCTQIVLFYLLNTEYYQGFPSRSHDFIYYFPLSHLCSFIFGIAGAYWIRNTTYPRLTVITSIFTISLSISTLLFLLEKEGELVAYFNIKIPYGASFYAPLFLLIIVFFSISNKVISSNLALKPFVALSEVSFAIYIMQNPVWGIVYNLFKNCNVSFDVILLIYISVLLIVGMILLQYFEKPFNNFAKKKLLC